MNAKKHLSWSRILQFAPVILLIVLLCVFAFVDDRIITGPNLLQILVQAAPIAILALGAMIVLISGGIDLSAGYGVGLCAVVVGLVLTNGGSLFSAIIITLMVGVVIGLFNGFFVGMLKIQAFIVTLGSMTLVQGATLLLATGGVLIVTDPVLKKIGVGATAGLPNIAIVTAVLIVAAALLIKQTSFGLRTYGIGSSLESSRSSGVPIVRQQLFVYIFSGVCTAITAILLVSRASIVSPNIGGVNLMLDAITATVIGGTSIFGGRGSIASTLVGAIIISLITHAMSVFGIGASSLDFFKGMIIVIALAMDSLLRAAQHKLGARQA
ncbi:Autoinducer 2 import system permease protein LsrC [Paenibacillus sp. CECT 9249]|uniref:ABC transporter permease n=1 Tax=Paenibacillus sp. CECT 9249 TaxID=2845385 RepID=UPI001E5A8ECC|nr:ABC transporter permease [Paenibacillus sp. CECT 9249]CAH0118932.1 Autoinducer 2 import system permease protein LsrC [Paenibacillus sp. CECT 9249]